MHAPLARDVNKDSQPLHKGLTSLDPSGSRFASDSVLNGLNGVQTGAGKPGERRGGERIAAQQVWWSENFAVNGALRGAPFFMASLEILGIFVNPLGPKNPLDDP